MFTGKYNSPFKIKKEKSCQEKKKNEVQRTVVFDVTYPDEFTADIIFGLLPERSID